MSTTWPTSPEEWERMIEESIGVSREAGESALASNTFPFDSLEACIRSTFKEENGFSPAFVPALLRNLHGLAAWVYTQAPEPYWPGSDSEVVRW